MVDLREGGGERWLGNDMDIRRWVYLGGGMAVLGSGMDTRRRFCSGGGALLLRLA